MAGKNTSIGGGGFHHLALRARDFEKSLKFYTEVMGFKVAMGWGEKGKRIQMLDTGDGNYFELFERPNQEAPPAGEALFFHVALRCSDVNAAIERVRAAGCEITMEPKDVTLQSTIGTTTIRIGFFKGPDGEILEFFQHDKS